MNDQLVGPAKREGIPPSSDEGTNLALHLELRLVEYDDAGVDYTFRADVLRGLAERQKAIPSRWFYDRTGSELFEQITALPEYYPSRVETQLLMRHGSAIASQTGRSRVVVEFGSGSSVKTPLLLREIRPSAYIPIDISGDFLRDACGCLASKFPHLPIIPVEANFMQPVQLPQSLPRHGKLGFFPGSTIGNMVPNSAVDLLRSIRSTLGDGSQLLVGVDRIKNIDRLLAAYDDGQGVTSRFNLNLLHRINRELDGDIPCEHFRHVARWNEAWSRVEMHLEALVDMTFTVSGLSTSMRQGETIHTENSHKYSPDQAGLLLQAAGWSPLKHWSDDDGDFMIILAEATEARSAP